jgi:hypothetical protein
VRFFFLKTGFTLNKDKITLGASQIKYLGHSLSYRSVRVISERIDAIKSFPCPKTFQAVNRFLGKVGFMRCSFQNSPKKLLICKH